MLFWCGCLAAAPAIADRPPADDPPPNTRGRSAGSRGCSVETAEPEAASENIPALILLTPASADSPGELSKTLSTQPTFAWFNRAGNQAIETVFRLYEYDEAAQSYRLMVESRDEAIQNQAGIVVASVAAEKATLSVGSRYLWQVGLLCDRNRPSGDLFAEAEFEVISASPTLSNRLEEAAAPADRAALLTSEGLWYDALSLVFTELSAPARDAVGDSMRPVREMLFEQVSFSDVEKAQLEGSSVSLIEITR